VKILGIIAAILLGAAGINAALNSQWYARQQQIAAPETQYDAVIRRDGWGVSHILGETDADAAFGLAYADADDHIARLYNARFPARAGGSTGAASCPAIPAGRFGRPMRRSPQCRSLSIRHRAISST